MKFNVKKSKEEKVIVSVGLYNSTKNKLQSIADDNGVSLALIIRHAVNNFIDEAK